MIVCIPNVGKFNVQFIKQHALSHPDKKPLIHTICKIFKYVPLPHTTGREMFPTEKHLISIGTAYQNPADRYNKVTGKKIALTRAMNSSGFKVRFPVNEIRDTRFHFWGAFWSEFGTRLKKEL
jgi:hypothetical protein